MPKIQEIDQSTVGSWLSSDLAQTPPEFQIQGSAGYGIKRRKFVPVRSITVVSPTGFLNPRSDRYERVATFLQTDVAGLDGFYDSLKEKAAKARDAALAAAKASPVAASIRKIQEIAKDPLKAASDLTQIPGFNQTVEAIIAQMKKNQDALYELYEHIKRVEQYKVKPEGFDKVKESQKVRAEEHVANSYTLYALPALAKRMEAVGITKPDISQPWILRAIQNDTFASKVYAKVKEGNGTGALAGLGVLPVVAIVAIVIGALSSIYIAARVAEASLKAGTQAMRDWRDTKLVDACKDKPECTPDNMKDLLDAAHKADDEAAKRAAEQKKLEDEGGPLAFLSNNLPWVIGGVLVIAFLPTLMAAGRAGAQVVKVRTASMRPTPALPAPMQGLKTRKKRRRRA